MKFVVKKDQWLRGDIKISYLLDRAQKRCCIGFVCQQLGIPDEELMHVRAAVCNLSHWLRNKPGVIVALSELPKIRKHFGDWGWEQDAYTINDSDDLEDTKVMASTIKAYIEKHSYSPFVKIFGKGFDGTEEEIRAWIDKWIEFLEKSGGYHHI